MQSSASSQIRRIGTTSLSIEFEVELADRIQDKGIIVHDRFPDRMVTGTITQIGLAATWNLLNESGPSSRESCRRSLFQVCRRQNRGQIAHSDPPDGGRRCSSVLLNAAKSNSDFWPFWNCDLVRTFSKWRVQMSWKAPKIVEVSVGMEINMYACAARK